MIESSETITRFLLNENEFVLELLTRRYRFTYLPIRAPNKYTQGHDKTILIGLFLYPAKQYLMALAQEWSRSRSPSQCSPTRPLHCRLSSVTATDLIFLFAGIMGGLADDDEDNERAGHVS